MSRETCSQTLVLFVFLVVDILNMVLEMFLPHTDQSTDHTLKTRTGLLMLQALMFHHSTLCQEHLLTDLTRMHVCLTVVSLNMALEVYMVGHEHTTNPTRWVDLHMCYKVHLSRHSVPT